MSVHVRSSKGRDEHQEQWRVVSSAFGEPVDNQTDVQYDRNQRLIDPRYSLVAVDNDEIVGGVVGVSSELVIPGGARVPINAVAGVGVAPHKTGRGAMRGLMQETIARAVDAGAAASVLMASEASLYGRFGYGCATSWASYTLDVHGSALVDLGTEGPHADAGSIDFLTDRIAAPPIMHEAYNQIIDGMVGQLARNEAWWELVFDDEAGWIGPAKPVVALHRDASGRPDGYALYTIGPWEVPTGVASSVVKLRELVAPGIAAELALWRFVTSLPLVRRVDWETAPVNPRLRHHLVDRRQLLTTAVHDMLWLRPLDVPRLLRERSYLNDGAIAIAIDDELVPSNHGPWLVMIADGDVDVQRVNTADITLTAEHFGMTFLGASTARELGDAGVLGASVEAQLRFDRLFGVDVEPFTIAKF